MQFIYKPLQQFIPGPILQQINTAAANLAGKLLNLDFTSMAISDYNKAYLNRKMRKLVPNLQIYTYLLALALQDQPLDFSAATFVDYGGGSGMLSLLARELGFGTVIYNDIYDVSCIDAAVIGKTLQYQADAYITGDIDAVLAYVKRAAINIDIIASFDVIEHIYDLESFFTKLYTLSSRPFVFSFGSGANIHNKRASRPIIKRQIEKELQDKQHYAGRKERDSLESYFKVREQIIQAAGQNLQEDEIEQLARQTRGLIKADILQCLTEYVKTGQISYQPDHPTNTCDPLTGNWEEHLLPVSRFREIVTRCGFTAAVFNGYYGTSRQGYVQTIKNIINSLIYHLKRGGLGLAPYFVIHAKKNG